MKLQHRIKQLENALEKIHNDNNSCYGYTFTTNTSDEEIIEALKITPKEFFKWKKGKDNFGNRMVFTPNWSIEKFLLQEAL